MAENVNKKVLTKQSRTLWPESRQWNSRSVQEHDKDFISTHIPQLKCVGVNTQEYTNGCAFDIFMGLIYHSTIWVSQQAIKSEWICEGVKAYMCVCRANRKGQQAYVMLFKSFLWAAKCVFSLRSKKKYLKLLRIWNKAVLKLIAFKILCFVSSSK